MKANFLRFSAIAAFGFFSAASFAGTEQDSSKHTSVFFSIDNRNSFITSSEARVIGFRGGVELNNKFRLAFGYHYLASEIVRTIAIGTDTTNAQVRLRYGSASAEYVLVNRTFWQLTAPFLLGFGESAYIPPSNKYGITERYFTLFVEPAVTFQYNLFPFIGIGTGIGYRFMPIGDSSLRSTFATPIYDLRINILIDDVIEVLFPNGLWKKKNEGEKSSAP